MKKTIALALTLVMVFALAACGGTQPPTNEPSTNQPSTNQPSGSAPGGQASDTPKYGGVLRWASMADSSLPLGLPQYLAAALTTLLPPWSECLLLEASDGTIHPHLAKEWDIRIDDSMVIFTLRDDVFFTDGSQLTAEVAKWNIDLALETKIMNPAVLGATVLDEFVVQVNLDGYTNAVMPIFASHSFCLASMETQQLYGTDYARANPVGTGPFIITEQIPGQRIIHERNDNYWMPGKPYLDGVEFYEMRDVMTQNAAVLSQNDADRVDVLSTANGEQIQMLLQSGNVYRTSNVSGPLVFYPDSQNPDSPLSKLEVRQALSYAIDREAICEARGFGIWQPATAFVPYPYYGHKQGQNFFSFDPAKAKELLASAGYPNGFTISMHSPSAVDRDAVVAMQSMLSDVGITANLNFPEAAAATELRVNGWDGIFVGTFGTLPSISSTYRLAADPGNQFYPSMWRPYGEIAEWNELYESARKTLVADHGNYERMHEALIEYMVMIPIFDQFGSYLINNRIHDTGWGDWGVGTIWLPWDAWID